MKKIVLLALVVFGLATQSSAQSGPPYDSGYLCQQLQAAGVPVGSCNPQGQVWDTNGVLLTDAASVASINACLATNLLGAAKQQRIMMIRGAVSQKVLQGFGYVLNGAPVVFNTDTGTQADVMAMISLSSVLTFPMNVPSAWLKAGSGTLQSGNDLQLILASGAAWRLGLSQASDVFVARVQAATSVAEVYSVPLQ